MSRDRVTMGRLAREHEAVIAGTAAALRDVELAARRLMSRFGWSHGDARRAVLEVLWTRREVPAWAPPCDDVPERRASQASWREHVTASQRGAAAAMRPATPVQTRFDAVPAQPPHKRRRCDEGRDPLEE